MLCSKLKINFITIILASNRTKKYLLRYSVYWLELAWGLVSQQLFKEESVCGHGGWFACVLQGLLFRARHSRTVGGSFHDVSRQTPFVYFHCPNRLMVQDGFLIHQLWWSHTKHYERENGIRKAGSSLKGLSWEFAHTSSFHILCL